MKLDIFTKEIERYQEQLRDRDMKILQLQNQMDELKKQLEAKNETEIL